MIASRLARSAADFERAVWPLLRDQIGGGELIPCETAMDSNLATALDQLGMTDAWQIVQPYGIRGLATRVQWGQNWMTWTVRRRIRSGAPTEWHKLTRNGAWHRPSLIIQAYLDRPGGDLLEAACIRTADMQTLLHNGWHDAQPKTAPDGNEFIVVQWLEVEMRGMPVLRIRP